MKKLLILLLVMAAALFCACDSDSGSEHGVPYIQNMSLVNDEFADYSLPASVHLVLEAEVTDLDWDVKKIHVSIKNTDFSIEKVNYTFPGSMSSSVADFTFEFDYTGLTGFGTYDLTAVFEDAGGRKSAPRTITFIVEQLS